MPTDHGQFNPSEPQTSPARNKVYDHAGGAGESCTDLQNTLGGRKASKRDARGKGSRELSAHQPTPPVADTGVGIDLNHDLEENEGEYWRGGRQKSHGTSRTLLILTFPYLSPDMDEGSVLNVGDGYYQGSQSRNPSRAFLRLVIF